jgi:hypothetical protein
MVTRSARLFRSRLVVLAAALLPAFAAEKSAHGQVTAQSLVGKAVSDDAQYGDINNAIGRFRDRRRVAVNRPRPAPMPPRFFT